MREQGYPGGCRYCRADGSQHVDGLQGVEAFKRKRGYDVNDGVEAFKRTTGYRVDMLSPTICFLPREDTEI